MFIYVVHNGEALHIYIPDKERQSFEKLYDKAKGDAVLLGKIIKQVNLYLLSEKQPLVVIPPKELVHIEKPTLSQSDISHVKTLANQAENVFLLSDADVEKYYDTIFNLHTKTPYLTVLQYCCRPLNLHEEAWKLQEGSMPRDNIYSLVSLFHHKLNCGKEIRSLLKHWRSALKVVCKYTREEYVEKAREWRQERQEMQKEIFVVMRQAKAEAEQE